jgi:hypothetical protein
MVEMHVSVEMVEDVEIVKGLGSNQSVDKAQIGFRVDLGA